MKRKLIKLATLIVIIVLHAQFVYCQTDKDITLLSYKSKHSVNIELIGRTIIFGSVNYEYALLDQLSIGGGLGLISFLNGNITRSINGETEEGKYFDTSTSQLLFANYFLGRGKHQCIITAGVTGFLFTYHRRYPSENTNSSEFQIQWNTGVGYQYSAKSFYYRATAYLISMPEPTGWFPRYIPWIGFSIGYRI